MIEPNETVPPQTGSAGTQVLLSWSALTAFFLHLFIIFQLMAAPSASALGLPPINTNAILIWGYVQPMLILIPALLIALRSATSRYRAVGWTLVWVAILTTLLNLVRQLFALDTLNGPAFTRIAVALVFSLPILVMRGGRPTRLGSAAVALLLGTLLMLPSITWGALGSSFDTFRALSEGIALGLIGAAALALLRPVLTTDRRGSAADIWTAGATLSVVLTSVAGAWGQDDQNLLLLLILPILGFPAVALARPTEAQQSSGWINAVLLMTLVAFAPLAFFDPHEQIILALLTGETATYAFVAALTTALLSLLLGITLTFISARPRAAASIVTWGVALLAIAGTTTIYVLNRPGLYGDHFFVMLHDQADLSEAATIDDIIERRTYVYTTLTEHASRSQADLRTWLDTRGIAYTPYYLVNAIEVHADLPTRLQIEGRDDVDRVLLSPILRPLPNTPSEVGIPTALAPEGPTWGVRAIGADQVWEDFGIMGEDIVIGQSDSGVDWEHPALQSQYRGRDGDHTHNWIDPWNNRPEPYDFSGHGTHTLGTMLGSDGIGVAPEATWFGCANLVRNLGSPAYYLDCMQFLLAPYPQKGDPFTTGRPELAADVSNNSWGCPPFEGCDARALEQGVAALRAAGIFVVASAGNDGPVCDSLNSPIAIYDEVLSVGALTETGNLADFSSRGPESILPEERRGPDLIAPGVSVISAWPGGGYSSSDGTSMAGPHVAGVVALLWSANPDLRGDIERTTEILRDTAQPYTGEQPPCSADDQLPDPATGFGIVDAYAAVEAALALEP
ncbi:MAG: peptidase S8 [Chloroflexi bacterium AL-W]|nr:peptidase S8 [Chloroflexi bacterium AL-N1]NOK65448.1 peptidase S8 [Chloroflexi bacterium AL-N10]NOK72286.1 peptidase S8 [Chloroflexi bacterium AL-N5]NOK79628.1 peptidase S8 [Chloroflexi bacterium AL-W]NOK87543.1 peptidase S8 [Chloroflexi bacterium AL-N15]